MKNFKHFESLLLFLKKKKKKNIFIIGNILEQKMGFLIKIVHTYCLKHT